MVAKAVVYVVAIITCLICIWFIADARAVTIADKRVKTITLLIESGLTIFLVVRLVMLFMN